jgi:transketolase
MPIINDLKKEILLAANKAGEGHVPSAFSIIDILWVLYDQILSFDSNNPNDENRDRFILSKGHGSLALYAVLAHHKFFDKKELKTFESFDSILGGHPDHTKVPGIEASTGSLGHGFPFAVGLALGLCIKNSEKRVFVLVGDQECNEGTIWESALLSAHHKLNNLCVIIDNNHSTDRSLSLGDLIQKFRAFGWETIEIDGHDHGQIYDALSKKNNNVPNAIIANTIKGHGIQEMENNPEWHHKCPTTKEIQIFLEELQ